jgi:hypothetical protein
MLCAARGRWERSYDDGTFWGYVVYVFLSTKLTSDIHLLIRMPNYYEAALILRIMSRVSSNYNILYPYMF